MVEHTPLDLEVMGLNLLAGLYSSVSVLSFLSSVVAFNRFLEEVDFYLQCEKLGILKIDT